MTWIAPLEGLSANDSHLIGGKGAALGRLRANRLRIPRTLCIATQANRGIIEA